MNTNNVKMSVSLVALAVQAALVGMFTQPAFADEAEIAALTKPANSIEVGAASVSGKSAKFGEYNGLNKSVVYGNLNFNVRGGDAYGDAQGINRWSLLGTDLGLSSRSFSATTSAQGKWSVGLSYDELTHNLTDTYETPYIGKMGGNNFTLPTTILFNVAANGLNRVGTVSSTNIPIIQAALKQVDIATTRKNTAIAIGRNLDEQWSVKFDFNHLDQTGAKLMGYGAKSGNGNISGQLPSILPNPTNSYTDTVNFALNFVGDNGHFSGSYFNSFYHDGFKNVQFQTYMNTKAPMTSEMQTMTTPPNNSFSQVNLNGGYDFTTKTKLTGGVSYGENTQNDAYVDNQTPTMLVVSPKTSLAGLVLSKHADMKLTNQSVQNLTVTASYKYDERNDKTASNFYKFNAINNGDTAFFANTPYSNKKTQSELAGDFRVSRDQRLRLAYNLEDVSRWCDQYAVDSQAGIPPTLGVLGGKIYYPNGTNCVVATKSGDEKLSATYKLKAKENLDFNLGYSYSSHKTNSDPNAITARIALNGNSNLSVLAANQIQGINGGDYLGYYPYFDASRKEKTLKTGVNWATTESLTLTASAKFTDDVYESTYGVKKGNSWSANLDSTYAYSDNGSISAFVTQQHRQRDLTQLQKSPTVAVTNSGLATQNGASTTAIGVPPGATWTNTLQDNETTVGVAAKQGGKSGSKLELTEDLTYSLGKTGYDTQLNYATTTSAGGFTCSSPQILTCGALPNISNKLLQFKLVGKYAVSKSTKVSFAYQYQQLKSDDYYYNGLQIGNTPNSMLPTNQQSPNYSVNVFSLGYVYDF